jgi:hypothetical protein
VGAKTAGSTDATVDRWKERVQGFRRSGLREQKAESRKQKAESRNLTISAFPISAFSFQKLSNPAVSG